MQLTEQERAALVDGRYNSDFHKGLVSAIEQGLEASRSSRFGDTGTVNRIAMAVTYYLLTDRPEPAADAIERAAKVLWDYRRRDTGWEPWEELRDTRPDGSAVESKSHYRDMARAVLAAVPTEQPEYDTAYAKGYQDEQEYTPRQVQQATCGSDECRADHERTGARERASLRKMLAAADQKRQEYDGIGKAQMAEVKRTFREARSLN